MIYLEHLLNMCSIMQVKNQLNLESHGGHRFIFDPENEEQTDFSGFHTDLLQFHRHTSLC